MAEKHMNGPEPFTHPVSGVKVGPFEWYEGFAHTDFERENLPADADGDEKSKRGKKKNKKDEVNLDKSDEGAAEEDSESEMGE